MKRIFGVVLLLVALAGVAEEEANPCTIIRREKRVKRQAVELCLNAWADEGKPDDRLPSNECEKPLAEYIQVAKTLKSCRVEYSQRKRGAN